MKRFIITFTLASLPLIAAGCINVNLDQTIEKDGSSAVTIENDLSQLASLGDLDDSSFGAAEGLPASDKISEFTENISTACDDFDSETALERPVCEVRDNVVTMSGNIQLSEEVFEVKKSIPYTTYRYDLKNAFSLLRETGGDQAEQLDRDGIKEMKAGADLIGMKMTYSLTMPAEISSADVGDINGTQLEVDIFDLVDDEGLYVEAQDLNWSWIIMLTLILLFGFVIFVVVVVLVIRSKMKKRKAAKQQSAAVTPESTEQKTDSTPPPAPSKE